LAHELADEIWTLAGGTIVAKSAPAKP